MHPSVQEVRGRERLQWSILHIRINKVSTEVFKLLSQKLARFAGPSPAHLALILYCAMCREQQSGGQEALETPLNALTNGRAGSILFHFFQATEKRLAVSLSSPDGSVNFLPL